MRAGLSSWRAMLPCSESSLLVVLKGLLSLSIYQFVYTTAGCVTRQLGVCGAYFFFTFLVFGERWESFVCLMQTMLLLKIMVETQFHLHTHTHTCIRTPMFIWTHSTPSRPPPTTPTSHPHLHTTTTTNTSAVHSMHTVFTPLIECLKLCDTIAMH